MAGGELPDSGKRLQFASGMQRDVSEGKVDYLLIRDGPMFERWALHLTRGARKYSPRNWMLAEGEEEYQRFRESAARHFEAWLRGDDDEDHAAAVFFNINGAEYVKAKMEAREEPDDPALCGAEHPNIPGVTCMTDVGHDGDLHGALVWDPVKGSYRSVIW